jgi:hypothetical protein
MLEQNALKPIAVDAQTAERAPLSFGPGTSWAPARNTDFTIEPAGRVDGLGGMSSFLQAPGKNRAMCPFVLLHVNHPVAGTFAVEIDQVTPRGARVEMKVDDVPAAAMTFGPYPAIPGHEGRPRPNPRPNATIEVPISTGAHTIRLENTGADWAHIYRYVLNPYAPGLATLARGNKNFASLWLYNRAPAKDKAVTATLHVPGLAPGNYIATWMDTRTGQIISQGKLTASSDDDAVVDTPPVAEDIAGWIARSE